MLFLWSHTWFCELLSSQNLWRLLHTSSANLLQDQTRGGGSLGNMREQSLAQVEVSPNAFLVSFHNYQQVVQGNEVEAFSLWKLFSRQGQASVAGKKAKSRQNKHPAGSEASLALHVPGGFLSSPHLGFCSSMGHGACSWHKRQKKTAARTSCQRWLLVSGTSAGRATKERASPLCPKGWRGCNWTICSVWR